MIFRLTAECTFEADDIDQAFLVLARHFLNLAIDGTDVPTLFTSGEIDLKAERP